MLAMPRLVAGMSVELPVVNRPPTSPLSIHGSVLRVTPSGWPHHHRCPEHRDSAAHRCHGRRLVHSYGLGPAARSPGQRPRRSGGRSPHAFWRRSPRRRSSRRCGPRRLLKPGPTGQAACRRLPTARFWICWSLWRVLGWRVTHKRPPQWVCNSASWRRRFPVNATFSTKAPGSSVHADLRHGPCWRRSWRLPPTRRLHWCRQVQAMRAIPARPSARPPTTRAISACAGPDRQSRPVTALSGPRGRPHPPLGRLQGGDQLAGADPLA